MNVFLRGRRRTLAEQYHGLRSRFPGARCYLTGNNKKLIWEGVLSPGPFSREYTVRVEYSPPSSPDCYIISPNLKELSQGKRIPHTYATPPYDRRTQLCLFLPKQRHPEKLSEWRPQLLLSETILPWASLWLFYFEQWMFSGKWEGGGAHPNPDDGGTYSDN
ncbi:hypothetical protein KSX65_15690 [Enterobacter hormaechei]|uniref:hypothetical protein n=1 Tax=Enterobacter hormaechei TaxID=158836 RepID=UPI00090826F9|nr:hypothetical protein [Enterobacter hormaechei]MBV1677080.1 hypothetical protein [Enterobacter hormaechei]